MNVRAGFGVMGSPGRNNSHDGSRPLAINKMGGPEPHRVLCVPSVGILQVISLLPRREDFPPPLSSPPPGITAAATLSKRFMFPNCTLPIVFARWPSGRNRFNLLENRVSSKKLEALQSSTAHCRPAVWGSTRHSCNWGVWLGTQEGAGFLK